MKKTVSFSKNSTNIFFHILTRCNLKCRHCYINQKQHGKNDVDLPTIKAWLGIFAEKSKRANVIFLGGEPTLHPDLHSAIREARYLGYSSITVDTNGYLFNNILSKVSPKDVDYFSFSLDGASRYMNDMIRGKGSYDKCISGIKKAKSKGFATSLIYTVSKENLEELDMMIPLLKNLGINRFFIQVVGIRGKSADKHNENIQVPGAKWLDIIPKAAEKAADLGIIVSYPKTFLSMEETFECGGLVAENYFIFPNGRVYRCPLCEDFPMHCLVLKDNKLVETEKINEKDIFQLNIPEGCVMNKLIQPGNLSYNGDGTPEYKIACCMLKEEIGYN